MRRVALAVLLCGVMLHGGDDELLEGFEDDGFADDVALEQPQKKSFSLQNYGFEGKLTQEVAYAYHNQPPHDKVNSLRSTLFLEYNHELLKGWKLKLNGNAFYDWSYLAKGREKFSQEDKDALESQIELFDGYIQGSLTQNLDLKLGRQVVVWGKSDTIRVVDILNPLDNRRPGMVDIEDLRLPVTMAKFDYYIDKWHITPIAVLEQREDKIPPYKGDFNPYPTPVSSISKPNNVSFALNIGGEFEGFDVDFYYANTYQNFEFYPKQNIDITKKVDMLGAAANVVTGSLLVKEEVAYFHNYRYANDTTKYKRLDMLVGIEYNGINETTISVDLADKRFIDTLPQNTERDNFQGAFRITSDFMHQTLHTNYLISVFGKQFDAGGYQRLWVDYDVSDSIKATLGVVDYLGGNTFFDAISDNDMVFAQCSYSF